MYTQNAQRKELCAFFYALAPSVRRRAARKPQVRTSLCWGGVSRPNHLPPLSNRGAQIIWKQSITYQKVLENRGLFKHSKECDKIGNCHIPFSIGGIETE